MIWSGVFFSASVINASAVKSPDALNVVSSLACDGMGLCGAPSGTSFGATCKSDITTEIITSDSARCFYLLH